MKIYFISQKEHNDYDTYDSHVIIADNNEQALKLAKEKAADEGKDAWQDENIVFIGNYEGPFEAKPFILLSSFNAG